MQNYSLTDWTKAARWGRRYANLRPARRLEETQIDKLHRWVLQRSTPVDEVLRKVSGLGEDLGKPSVQVVSRTKFVQANVESVRGLADPHAKQLARLSNLPEFIRRRVLAHNIGMAVGTYAAVAIAQHELFLPPAHKVGRTWLIGPNLVDLSFKVGVDISQIITGVLCHELAHRLQFESIPWVREHAERLLHGYIGEIDHNSKAFIKAMSRFENLLLNQIDEEDTNLSELGVSDMLDVILTPSQVRAVQTGQAMFSVLEGHATLMASLAAEILDFDFYWVEQTLADHGDVHSVVERVTDVIPGLSVPRAQRSPGTRFVTSVYRRGGLKVLNRLWDGPDNLPTPEEIKDPVSWIKRIK